MACPRQEGGSSKATKGRNRMKRWSAAVLFLFPLTIVAAPADKPTLRAGETIEVSIVNLDVIVTDKRGNRIHGLTKRDFEVLEEGKPQAITNFAAYVPRSGSQVTDSNVTLSTSPDTSRRQHRTIAIFIEHFKLPGFQVRAIFDSLKRTLHKIVAPGDAVLIATWQLRTVVRQDYTDDLTLLDNQLDQIAKESTGAGFNSVLARNEEMESLKEFLEGAQAAAAAKGFSGNADIADWAESMDNIDRAEKERRLIMAKVQAVDSLINTMANDDGRKAVILMTRRFSRIAGGEFFFMSSAGGPLSSTVRSRYDMFSPLDKLKETANANGVTLYAMYPPGLESTFFGGSTQRTYSPLALKGFDNLVLDNELDSLGDITRSTGGILAWGNVDIASKLSQVGDDFDDYYSLAYRAPEGSGNRVRDVVVRTRNRDYVVRSRRQYMRKDDDGRLKDRVLASLFRASASSGSSAPAPSGISVTADVGKPVKETKHSFRIPVSIRIPAKSLMTTQNGSTSKGAFTVYVATGRVIGETSDVSKQTIPFTITDVEKAKDGFFTYDFDLRTDALTNALAVGIYDEVSRDSGFARVDLYTVND